MLAASLQTYSVLPAGFPVRPLDLPPDTRAVVLLLHGSGGSKEPTMMALEQRLRAFPSAGSDPVIVRYIWSPYSDAKLRAQPNGSRVGRALGAELAGMPQLTSVHLIAHSAGSYIVEPLCEALRAGSANRPGGAPQI